MPVARVCSTYYKFVRLHTEYCIPAMLRDGISANALISTLGHGVNLRFVHHVTMRTFRAETVSP